MRKSTLTIVDNRTGKTYVIPIEHDTIRAIDLRQIKVIDDDFGMMTYDPADLNTASVQKRNHLHRWSRGHFAVSRLSYRAIG